MQFPDCLASVLFRSLRFVFVLTVKLPGTVPSFPSHRILYQNSDPLVKSAQRILFSPFSRARKCVKPLFLLGEIDIHAHSSSTPAKIYFRASSATPLRTPAPCRPIKHPRNGTSRADCGCHSRLLFSARPAIPSRRRNVADGSGTGTVMVFVHSLVSPL